MTALRLLLCDDEPLAVRRLTAMLAEIPDIAVVASTTDAREAVDLVRSTMPDLLLLDIEMPDIDGFDIVEAVAKLGGAGAAAPLVAFVTAYRKFAPQAFETGAIDFLPKPVRLNRLETMLARARHAIEGRQAARRLIELEAMLDALRANHLPARDAHVWVPRRGEVVRIDLDRTDRIVAEGAYVRLHVEENSYLHRAPIGEIESQLDPVRFLRVHRSHIVRVDHVAAIRRTIHGAGELVLRNGQRVPLGRKYSRDARRRLMAAAAAH
ncbi:MAG TPA: LytTR family DNA-binding domain-containing protein [Sphingomonas sp.]|nr:LytTR family DNA-binding domain-containing protein [Sphingomonas sp.]